MRRWPATGDQISRTSLAFARSDPDVIYALAGDQTNHVLGVFRSTNGGNSWREVMGPQRYPKERQMSYNNVIAVHPRNPDSVIWGGMHLYRTDNAGRSWRRITDGQRGERGYVHSDHQALLWPGDDLIISGNDGGVSVTDDGGRNWTERSRGMVSTMFYDLDGGAFQLQGLVRGHPGQRDPDCRRRRLQGRRFPAGDSGRWRLGGVRPRRRGQRLRMRDAISGLPSRARKAVEFCGVEAGEAQSALGGRSCPARVYGDGH